MGPLLFLNILACESAERSQCFESKTLGLVLRLCGRARSQGFGTVWERPDQETQEKGRYVGGGTIYCHDSIGTVREYYEL